MAVWDFDDTLVPWYKMKRAYGDQATLDLYDDWSPNLLLYKYYTSDSCSRMCWVGRFQLNRHVQDNHLDGSDSSWSGASRVSKLSGRAQAAARNTYARSRESLVNH